ncbi:MAG: hypothetical protein A2142_09480 [candidate division Zixibacteria bacterium RBG_16_48_11]|nr:MAG: hypothetical protein A2142_09480 [candidate division Zixibacteria bacterium RBG_16_48_11]
MRARKSGYFAALGGVAVTFLVLFSLGLKCNVEGTRPDNSPPTVEFANIPTEGTTFTSQPLVYWFGKDLDGFVAKYQYVVFKASQIQLLGYDADSTAVENSFFVFLKSIPHDLWIDSLNRIGKTLDSSFSEKVVKPVELETQQGSGQTNDRVTLFASDNPNDIILQYIFLRAVDNANAVSDVEFRKFFRTNNPPNTKIEFDNHEIYYSLPDTTPTWKGISMAWGGNDSIDYPTGDAPLEFFWELFYLGEDPLNPNPTDLKIKSFDSDDGDQWVNTKNWVFPFDPQTGQPVRLSTGYYMFRVTSRDDAFILDPTPALTVFYVIEPTFDKDVILIDITSTARTHRGVVNNPSIYRPFYTSMLADAGYPTDTIWASGSSELFPSERLLSRYKSVLVANQDPVVGISDSLGRHLMKYLDVGGKVWITGIYNFTTADAKGLFAELLPRGQRILRLFEDEFNFAPSINEAGYGVEMGMDYFGLEGYFMPFWDDLEDSINCVSGTNCEANYQNWPPYPAGRNEEFIGAASLLSSPWPKSLEVDTVKVKQASVLQASFKIIFLDKAPRISYATISSIHPRFPNDAPAEAIYLFNSAYGSSSIMHGKPAIIRYQGPTFRTAICTFPLFYIKHDQSVEFTKQLLQWFFSPDPVS